MVGVVLQKRCQSSDCLGNVVLLKELNLKLDLIPCPPWLFGQLIEYLHDEIVTLQFERAIDEEPQFKAGQISFIKLLE